MNGSPPPSENGFRPLWLLRNRHVQTILGHLLSGPPVRHPTQKHRVPVSDGDQLVLHDSIPDGWRPGDRIAVLIHGLGGCHDSGHPRRFARRLLPLGVRAVRVDLRGCGDGLPLARRGYHAGCSDDLRAVLGTVHAWSPTSPILLVGVSLGGNVVLKLTGEAAVHPVPGLARVAVMGPPIDLHRCAAMIERRQNRIYDRHFANHLVAQALRRQRYFPDPRRLVFPSRITIRLFDELYTAPRSGFRNVDDYYTRASSAPLVEQVQLPALILTARDDPFIAVEPFEALRLPANVSLHIVAHGGHLGFLGNDGAGGVRWAERKVVEWLLGGV
ncbi:MAG TPA: alpha/beta fold hydrolase [Gemmataceae bacterium]|nr:alpha/beta fold hydrolase [Gemmataceae bacterium]